MIPNPAIKNIILKLALTALILFPAVAYAFPLIPSQIVPVCSVTQADYTVKDPCNSCHLFQLIQNILHFLWGISIPLAVLMLAYGGFLMIVPFSGESSKMHQKGVKVIKNALIGLVIITFAWLIIDTIIKVVVGKQEISDRSPAIIFGPWNKLECKTIAGSSQSTSGQPAGNAAAGNVAAPIDLSCFRDGYYVCSPEAQALLKQPGEGSSWKTQDGSNVLTSKGAINCAKYNGALNPYSQYIALAAQKYGVSPERIESLILIESSGLNTTIIDRNGQPSIGLMQVQPKTAKFIDPSLRNLSDNEVQNRLKDPQTNIDIGTRNLSFLLKIYGGSYTLATAAHNGGPVANENSRDCPATGNLPGLKKWQCLYDERGCYGTGYSGCAKNTGFAVTRKYVPTADALEQAIRDGKCQPITQ